MSRTLTVALQSPYEIEIGSGILQNAAFLDFCRKQARRLVIVTDSTTAQLYGRKVEAALVDAQPLLIEIPAGEANKTREIKQLVENQMLAAGCGRDTCILALGGGVVSDLAGFVGATYCRGIPVVYAPTTLLAMVDASVGGKTGVNTPHGKNMIGAFHQPRRVFMDVDCLETLPLSEIDNGMAEMLKHALIRDAKQFTELTANARRNNERHWLLEDSKKLVARVAASVQIKKDIVEQDERDVGMRQLLNFGHTIGHAVEQLSSYTIAHGHAVAIGMLVESRLSMLLGFLTEADFLKIQQGLETLRFSLWEPWLRNVEGMLQVLHLDKKARGGDLHFVLLKGIGVPQLHETGYTGAVLEESVRQAVAWYNTNG